MARIPQVTRTITTTKVTAMVVNIERGETETKALTLPRTYKDKEALLKQAKKVFDNDNEKVVAILDSKEEQTLYGMTEQMFIEHAQILPPRTEADKEDENDSESDN